MGVQKEFSGYKIYRSSWWKFWEIDRLDFSLPSRYEDAYEEVERKTMNGWSCSMELRSWVIEDVREQLSISIVTYGKLAKKAKKLSVNFHTRESSQFYTDGMDFYLRGEGIYFDCDNVIKREKLLNKLGI